MLKEKVVEAWNGIPVLLLLLSILVLSVVMIVWTAKNAPRNLAGLLILFWTLVVLVDSLFLAGLFTVQPNQGVVLTLFGKYVGTVSAPGLRFANPFFAKKRVSLRVRNFETSKMKVNDHDGNPIEIAAAMLRRQQASAVVAARQKTVEGAVGMVEMALEMLARKNVIQLDGEQRATMVQNLLVVLCGEAAAQPVLNTGTLYQ